VVFSSRIFKRAKQLTGEFATHLFGRDRTNDISFSPSSRYNRGTVWVLLKVFVITGSASKNGMKSQESGNICPGRCVYVLSHIDVWGSLATGSLVVMLCQFSGGVVTREPYRLYLAWVEVGTIDFRYLTPQSIRERDGNHFVMLEERDKI
jgi:hypothetical protein